jgi:hypothetical protein
MINTVKMHDTKVGNKINGRYASPFRVRLKRKKTKHVLQPASECYVYI